MPLPSHNRIKHEAIVKGLKGKLVFTPFTVADRRNLLAALAFEDPRAFIRTVVDIVTSNSNLADLDPRLTLHFIETAFMRIYAVSSGSSIEATYTCDSHVPENLDPGNDLPATRACGEVIELRLPIDDVDVDFGPLDPTPEQVVHLSGDTFIVLEVPGWEDVSAMLAAGKEIDFGDEFVLKCVKSVGEGDKVYTRDDFTSDELAVWLNDMDATDAEKVKVFFSNLPVVSKRFDLTCPACGTKKTLNLRGLDSFFG